MSLIAFAFLSGSRRAARASDKLRERSARSGRLRRGDHAFGLSRWPGSSRSRHRTPSGRATSADPRRSVPPAHGATARRRHPSRAWALLPPGAVLALTLELARTPACRLRWPEETVPPAEPSPVAARPAPSSSRRSEARWLASARPASAFARMPPTSAPVCRLPGSAIGGLRGSVGRGHGQVSWSAIEAGQAPAPARLPRA